jgi:hypothetical protein
MDLEILKKKISSYRTPKGRITSLPDQLLGEILHCWEQWSGQPQAFYKGLGVDYRKMGSLMGRAKKLKREGAFDGLNFTEVVVEKDSADELSSMITSYAPIELVLGRRVIRFATTDLLVEFLEKTRKRPSKQAEAA